MFAPIKAVVNTASDLVVDALDSVNYANRTVKDHLVALHAETRHDLYQEMKEKGLNKETMKEASEFFASLA